MSKINVTKINVTKIWIDPADGATTMFDDQYQKIKESDSEMQAEAFAMIEDFEAHLIIKESDAVAWANELLSTPEGEIS